MILGRQEIGKLLDQENRAKKKRTKLNVEQSAKDEETLTSNAEPDDSIE